MKAIVDCNSFYCSCERLFRPELDGKPVVVLSNNDGCIISRTDEAKTIGVGMAGPFFKARELIEAHNIKVFSSNYNLYGNLSWRVMETLRELVGDHNVEVYSVDEAFVDLDDFGTKDLKAFGLHIRHTVEQWTGIKVSVGIAPTKTLAKLANNIAKQHKGRTQCVLALDTEERIERALKRTPVKELWGVGRRSADKLNAIGLEKAWDLYSMSEEWVRHNLGGVTGVRIHRELHGQEAIGLEDELVKKKMITTTRMFGTPVKELSDIKEALATYTARAAEKLRRQHGAATVIQVFVVPKENKNEKEDEGENDETEKKRHSYHGPSISRYTILASPTVLTQELIKPAMRMAEQLFEPGKLYKKAGVILSGLVPDSSIQANLFEEPANNVARLLMDMMDNINFSMRNDVVKFAASGTSRNWKMRQEFHSPRYTTRWEELYQVK